MSTGRRRLLILFVLVSAAVALMSYQHNKKAFSFFDVIISYPYYALNEFTANTNITIRRMRSAFEDNELLRKEVNQLQLERRQYREIILENERLKALLSFKEQEPRFVTAARVIARGSDRL